MPFLHPCACKSLLYHVNQQKHLFSILKFSEMLVYYKTNWQSITKNYQHILNCLLNYATVKDSTKHFVLRRRASVSFHNIFGENIQSLRYDCVKYGFFKLSKLRIYLHIKDNSSLIFLIFCI